MGKRGRKLVTAIVITALCTSVTWAREERRIEQVCVNMPEVIMYADGMTVDEIRAAECYLAQEKLTPVGEPKVFADCEEGICYYVLLDISGSISDAYFKAMKDGIMGLQEHLMPKDKLVLYSFGNEVQMKADGSQNTDVMKKILDELKNKDQETVLFEAIHQVASISEQEKNENITRQILVVMTDGEDFALGKKQAQEAQDNLRDKGIPTYAFGIQDTEKEYINSFGEFARNSGGNITVFTPEDGRNMLLGLQQSLQDDVRAEYHAASNLVTYHTETFSLKLADDTVIKKEVMSDHWIPDNENPYLVKGICIGNQQLRLEFNEPLQGLDGSANYQLTFEGRPVAVTGISYDKGSSSIVNLSLEVPVRNGIYQLDLTNITDISMEKNPVMGDGGIDKDSLSVGVVAIEVTNAPQIESELLMPEKKSFDYTGVLFLIFSAVVVLIIVVVTTSSKKKTEVGIEHKEEPEQFLLNQGEFSQHVVMVQPQVKQLQVMISQNGLQPRFTVWQLGTSLIIGRSSICDICIDDREMSRQHFCLERDRELVYITDLHSTNGTSVNGIRIGEKRRLDSGSTIEVGSIRMIIRW